MPGAVTINKYLPIAVLYFFFNSFLLPHGLLYTTLLTPFFIIWLYRYPSFNLLLWFFVVSIPFLIVHLAKGVDALVYIKSYLLFFSVYVFGVAFYQFLKNCHSLSSIFKSITIINIFLVLLALLALAIPPLKQRFWYDIVVTPGVPSINRLQMLTYEPSYYSILLVPIVLYYYLKMLLLRLPNKLLVFLLLAIPLFLSLSFGVIFGLLITFVLIFVSDVKLFTFNKKFPLYILYGSIAALIAFVLALELFPDNIFFLRIANSLSGHDASFKGRTFDSFYLGWQIAAQKSILFGVGPGQVKPIGLDFFRVFYNYPNFTENEISIPNSLGDILATLGILGVLIKLSLELFFFFKTKTYSNFFRLGLFLFAFIYQFTGSYITNIAEYVIWIMAFSPWLFTEFNKINIYKMKYSNEGLPAAPITLPHYVK